MTPSWLLLCYCVLVALSSLAGGVVPVLVRMTHLRTQLLMSFVSGLMLAIAITHLIPHSMEMLPSSTLSGAFTLGGVIGMFLLLRVFHAHHHAAHEDASTHSMPCEADDRCHAHSLDDSAAIESRPIELKDGQPLVSQKLALPVLGPSAEAHSHHHEQHDHDDHAAHKTKYGWIGMLFGLGLHTMMDGVALAASVAAEAHHGAWMDLAGLGTFLAVALHKPIDAFSIGSIMRKDGWGLQERSAVNLCFSLACPLGAMLFWLGATRLGAETSTIVGCGLALSAGFFICIALADLLPEVHFHDHDRLKLTLALFLGILMAIGIESLPGHQHGIGDTHSHDGESAPKVPAVSESLDR